jgi:hypothetical protein
MLTLHPNILEKNGNKEFAILPFEEFVKIQTELQNYEDLKNLRDSKATEEHMVGLTLEQAKNEWAL